MYGVVFSSKDPAGSGIARYIVDYYGLEPSRDCIKAIKCYVGENFYLAGFE
ncbi:MAG: D-tyrosyl-tRNA(Tyr) deacylase, partial [Desulfurococcales archaeon ex4484_58]